MDKHQSRYTRREVIHTYNTSGRCDLDMLRCRLFKTPSDFPVPVLKFSYRLPVEVKLLDKGRLFKVLKTWLVDATYYYSLDEWFEDFLAGLGRE